MKLPRYSIYCILIGKSINIDPVATLFLFVVYKWWLDLFKHGAKERIPFYRYCILEISCSLLVNEKKSYGPLGVHLKSCRWSRNYLIICLWHAPDYSSLEWRATMSYAPDTWMSTQQNDNRLSHPKAELSRGSLGFSQSLGTLKCIGS